MKIKLAVPKLFALFSLLGSLALVEPGIANAAPKIVSQKEQTSKRSSGQSDESGKKTSENTTLEAAKAEYEASSRDEAARIRYVTKLADAYYRLLLHDWGIAKQGPLEDGDAVQTELAKHPAPANSDSTKLSQLLVGEWAAVRHGNPYTFRADGKWGRSGSLLDDRWSIKGNEFLGRDANGKIYDSGTIILLNGDYFIYSDRSHNVIFYVRSQKVLADSELNRKQPEAAPVPTPPAETVSTETVETEFQAAKHEYEQSSQDEEARTVYVTKLAKIRDSQIRNYWKTGDKNFDSATAINEELRKHPVPANSDSRELSQFLIGKWQSPRRVYVFRKNGKWGNEDGAVDGNWRIKGNQLIQDGSHGAIILLDSDYFIYAQRDSVFFHARVKD